MKRKIIVAFGFTLVLIGVSIYSYYQDDGASSLINIGLVVFGIALATGFVIRLVRAMNGSRIRDAFGPVVAAADAYQSIILSRPTAGESTGEAANHESGDRYTTGP